MQGASTRRTSLGWKVVRIHYSADEDKDPRTERGAKWLAEAKKGVSDARWRKEFEIDYGALGGQLVFPGFDESIHVVPPYLLPIGPNDWTVWLACDPHPRRAHAFLWLAINKYGQKVVPWSYWPEEINESRRQQRKGPLLIREYVELLREIENAHLWPASYIELMDPAGKNFNADEEENFFDRYQACGVHFRPAKKNREYAGYDLINDALTPKEFVVGDVVEMRPDLTILAGCGDNDKLVHQLKSLRFREYHGTVTDKDAPSDPEDKERHLVDCLSYIFLDGPRFIDQSGNYSDPGDDPNIPRAHSSIGY